METLTKQLSELTGKRKRWVEANRENGFEDGITNLLTELYPDNAHFIYELLQNAEDTHADTVRFTLSEDDVCFEHNGCRLFNLKDVESITSIGVSTKRDDPTNIGKFGVGFKAVFAYTNTPEIRSGDFQFKISNLVVPELLPNKATEGATAFRFPFDNPKKHRARAVEEIDHGLRSLADNTLLFLNHIREIEYMLPNFTQGKLKRVDVNQEGIGQHIEIHAIQPEEEEVVSNWLRYRKEVLIKDETGKTKTCQVAIAFRLEQQMDDSQSGTGEEKKNERKPANTKTEWKIAPCEPGQVAIYFPADKETSNLRFHVHAPFASTVARDSVRDCDSNNELLHTLAQLMAEALADIRDRGLLTMSFLAILPNEDDGLSEFYQPIREAIVKAFYNDDLLPTKIGTHFRVSGLYRGPAAISSVIDDDDLSFLAGGDPPLWAANAPQKGQRVDKFLDSLEVDEWGWRELKSSMQETMHNEVTKRGIEKWISAKPDNWLMRFYSLMESCHHETKGYFDKSSPLLPAWTYIAGIRSINRKGVEKHVMPEDAFFPPQSTSKRRQRSINVAANICLVKPEVYEKGRLGETTKKAAREFLERVGVREYGERAEIERRLDRYSRLGEKNISEAHYRDIQFFISFVSRNPGDANLFEDVAFLLTTDGSNLHFTKPCDSYLDVPFEATGLGELVDIHGRRALSPKYLEMLGNKVSVGDFASFLKSVGVMHQLVVTEANARRNPQVKIPAWGNESSTKINVDWIIPDIENYLIAAHYQASRMVWQALITAEKSAEFAKFRLNQQHDLQIVESQLVQHLKSCAWIPDKNGHFHRPQDMTQDMLPRELPYDNRNGLLSAIGFGEKARETSAEFRAREAEAKNLGFDSVTDMEEARDLLRAKREGRIREVPKEDVELLGRKHVGQAPLPVEPANKGNEGTTQTHGTGASKPVGAGETLTGNPQGGDPAMRPVLRGITERVRKPGGAVTPVVSDGKNRELSEDDDDYTPAPVDYSRIIARAEERNAAEIVRLEREQELLNIAISSPAFSYGWFLALLELECMANLDKNADGKTISISFGRIENDTISTRTIILKEPSRFIPQYVEDLSGVPVHLHFDDGRSGKLHVESFTVKEFSLLGKLKSVDELSGLDLSKVVEARIDVQNTSFLLQELLNRFKALEFKDDFDMRANLTPNIEFVFGPPGTGKTTHLAENVLIPLMCGAEKAKVLVLTPTNKAADVLTTRIMDKMGPDKSFLAWLVRFGTSVDERIEKEGVWRERSFDIGALDRSVTVSTIARFAYDGFSMRNGKLHEMEWDIVVFDEASMIPLVNIIYPLYLKKPRKFIVAGDPFQIEPIVSVDQWKDQNIYTLVGLNKPGAFANPSTEPHAYPVTNLETQYRSVPAIGEIFSRFTYNGILNHHRVAGAQRPLRVDGLTLHPLNLIKFPVSKFESIYRAKRLKSGTSYQTYSALFTFEFVRWLAGQIQANHAGEPPFRIGIIAPYRAQANLLSKLNDSLAGTFGGVEIQVESIHGFQGDECDIIIAVFNPPPYISESPKVFLNKQNILNVAISRARDYLFIVMPDGKTENVGKLRKIARIEGLVRNSGAFSEYESHAIEEVILGNAHHLDENVFATGHQMVNVYQKPERYYEVRSDETAIDVQIHKE